jgi:hypothetical protein
VQEAQNSKAPAQLLVDKAAQWLVIAAIVIGLATFAVWFWWIGQPLLFAVTMTLRTMHQNLWWAVGYDAIAFPLAAGVLYPFVLSPEVAAMSMSGSTLIVASNALMLRRTKLTGMRQPGKTVAPASPDGPTTPEPAKASAMIGATHRNSKAKMGVKSTHDPGDEDCGGGRGGFRHGDTTGCARPVCGVVRGRSGHHREYAGLSSHDLDRNSHRARADPVWP